MRRSEPKDETECAFCGRPLREFILACRYCEASCHEYCVIHHEEECPDRGSWEKEQEQNEGYYDSNNQWRKK
jgi:hypothetical protein